MPAVITTLIDKVDVSEQVRDQIASILKVESANQEVLAAAAAEDPALWKLRVFSERANPWEAQNAELTPIVSVSLQSVSFDGSRGDIFESQQADAVFNIDCYGFGISEDDGGTGHTPGDQKASMEAQRAMRLVRNILMAAHYVALGLDGVVTKRFPRSIQVMQPALDDRTVERVCAARLQLEVSFTEFAPQHVEETLETLSVEVYRDETGELYLRADYVPEI